MRLLIMFVFTCFVLTLAQSTVLAQQEEQVENEDKLLMYRNYIGKMKGEMQGKATDVNPEPYSAEEEWESIKLLDGKMIQIRGKSTMDGKESEYLWLYTYHVRLERFVGWYHDSWGINSRMFGEWSEKEKTMTWTIDDPEAWGMNVTVVDDLSDPEQLNYAFKVVMLDGTVALDHKGFGKHVKE